MPKNKKDDVVKEILERFEEAETFYSEEYRRSREDMEFCLGKQWDDRDLAARIGRPNLVENRVLAFVNEVVNNIREQNPSIVVRPVDSNADVDTAEIIKGIIKNIEIVSNAGSAYDAAAFNAVSGAYGYILLGTRYASPYTFDQEIFIERVLNPHSAYLDPMSKEADGSDACWFMVIEKVSREQFEKDYPKADLTSFETNNDCREWLTDDEIQIVNYYYKEYEDAELVEWYLYDEVLGVERRGASLLVDMPEGAEVIGRRTTQKCKIKWCKSNGAEELETGVFPGENLPIVPVYGLEVWNKGRRMCYSLIHQAKDPQRMLNYWLSTSTEIMALQPRPPFLATPKQIQNYQDVWESANTKNIPYLPYEPEIKDGFLIPPPQRMPPPEGSQAMMQGVLQASDGIKAVIGMYNPSLGQESSDVSGKAIIARQLKGDTSNFHFVDNLSTALKRLGKIIVDLIPLVYSGERVVRIIGEDGADRLVPLNQPVVKEGRDYRKPRHGEAPNTMLRTDMGKYDVDIQIGASYATRRQETANAMIELMRVNPAIMEVAGDIFIKNLDFPQADELAKRMRAVIDPAVLGDDPSSQRMQAMQQMNAELQKRLEETTAALDAKRQNEAFKNQIEWKKVQKDLLLAKAEFEKMSAETDKLRKQSDVEIPAQAMVDVAKAIVELDGRMNQIDVALRAMPKVSQEEKATGQPGSPVE